jgi:GNAT superfamily N-acetyltransferase
MKLPPGYYFRPGRITDGPALSGLVFGILREHGLEPDPTGTDAALADVESHYARANGWFEVLCHGADELVGSVGLARVRPGVFELRTMYLKIAHRGQGLGRALLDLALAEARHRGAIRVTLETAKVLRKAVALYERRGFRHSPIAPHIDRCDLAMELELPFERRRGAFEISTDLTRFDLPRIQQLLAATYWATGIPQDVVARSLTHSLSFGVFAGPQQIGLARAVTDRATYAYLCDVLVDETHRGQGVGRWLVETVLAHPDLQGLRRLQLVTRDRHPLYRPFGFQSPAHPDRHLEITRPNPYARPSPPAG